MTTTHATAIDTEALARQLARNHVASGYDMGPLYDAEDFGALSDVEWDAICNRAEEIAPTVNPTAAERQAYADADHDFSAERAAEHRHFSS